MKRKLNSEKKVMQTEISQKYDMALYEKLSGLAEMSLDCWNTDSERIIASVHFGM
ncbi:hypothetical protein [Algoriphagus aquimarinus]|uniref:hypothetical protein n=1 Tax=Algoriphagus aquimarinus TaxID=237018 RepID=UPI00174CE005|nr:hypothetical protein [Algoriphagus aquimarinus]